MADYHERWSRAGSKASFDVWREKVRELEATHGTPELKTGDEGSLSMHPHHDPATETLQHVETKGLRATVRSMMPGSLPRYYEYRLRLVEEDWRIDRVVKSFDPPGVPVLQPAAAADLLAQATDDAPLPALSDHLELDVELLFTPGRQVRILDESLTTEVQPVGTLTTSGVLAAAGRTNVALRLRLTDRPTVEHRVAEFADGSVEISVDAGNVALADAGHW